MYAEREYIKGRGIPVGEFMRDVPGAPLGPSITQAMKETGLRGIRAELIRKNWRIYGVRVYVCTLEDMGL